jgi:endonuclease YncB( thermonuclease family)
MRRPLCGVTILLCGALLAAPAAGRAATGRAVGPQAIRLDTGEEVELGGIRAPDPRDARSAHAQEYLVFLIQNKELSVERERVECDDSGHVHRYAWIRRVPDGDSVNREMVLAGYASAYTTRAGDPDAAALIEAEIEAREHRRGLWASEPARELLFGNPRSRIFHTPDCPTLPMLEHPFPFTSRDQAVRCTYRPCRLCLPF